MVLSLRDLAAFAVPPADPTVGSDSMHRFASGLREMAQLGLQRDTAQAEMQQRATLESQRLAANRAAAAAEEQARIAEENRKRAESRRVGAQKAFGEFSQLLHQPGGAARAESQLPALQAHGLTWQALPDGGYGFVYQGDNGTEQWGKLDLGKMSAEDRAATERMLGAAVRAQTGRTPTEVAAAGKDAVLADPTLAGKDALAAFGSATNPQLNRQQSAENSRRVAAGMAAARETRNVAGGEEGFKGDPVNLTRALQRQQALVRERLQALRPLREAIAQSKKAVEAMQSDNPLEQATAFFARLHGNQGSRPTDKDLQFELQAGGLLSRLESGITRAMNGEFGEEYREDFVEAARRVAEYDQQRLVQEARATGDLVRSDPGIPLLVGRDIAERLSLQAEQWLLGGGMPDEGPPVPDGGDPDAELDTLIGGP